MNGELLSRMLKYAAVGAFATAMQFGVLVLCVELWHWSPVLGSSVGFILSAGLNYWLNYHLTFRSTNPHSRAVSRFAATAAAGLAINAALMALLVRYMPLPYLAAQVITTAVVLAWNFTVNSLWAFAGAKQQSLSLSKGSK